MTVSPAAGAAPSGAGVGSAALGSAALVAEGFSKSFGGTAALREAGLRVERGSIHALLGGNGSGKSTFIKCVAGVYQADSGELTVHGVHTSAAGMTPSKAHRLDLRFVHQDLGLFPQLSIAENVALLSGYPTAKIVSAVRWRRLDARVRGLLDDYEIAARPSDPVSALRPSQRSMLAIARALEDQASDECVLLLDEPTATLAEHEASELLAALRRRADAGQTIVLVSHRFPEVESVADHVTVFRDGMVVASDRMADMPIERLVHSMTGGALPMGREGLPHEGLPREGTPREGTPRESLPVAVRAGAPSAGDENSGAAAAATVSAAVAPARFSVSGLSAGAARDVSFEVAPGEIVGLAGLGGSGRSSILRAAFGTVPQTSGTMQLGGTPYEPRHEAAAMAAAVAFVPEDRLGEAAFLDLSVRENMSISVLPRFWRRLKLDRRAERASTAALIDRFRIRTRNPESPLGSLSGGNQQKVVLARWLQRKPRLLLLDEPTQGVDVVARAEIYATIAEAAAAGCSVLVASSDLDELLTLTHRVIVLRDGHIVATLDTSHTDREEIAHLMMLDQVRAS